MKVPNITVAVFHETSLLNSFLRQRASDGERVSSSFSLFLSLTHCNMSASKRVRANLSSTACGSAADAEREGGRKGRREGGMEGCFLQLHKFLGRPLSLGPEGGREGGPSNV